MPRNNSSENQESAVSRNCSVGMRRPRLLLAEDDDEMRRLIADGLRHEGYEVTECPHGLDMLSRVASFELPERSDEYDLIIADIRLPGLTALEILAGLHDEPGIPPVILMTAFGGEATHVEARRCGVIAVFDKPFEIDALLAKVRGIVCPQLGVNKESGKMPSGTRPRRLADRES